MPQIYPNPHRAIGLDTIAERPSRDIQLVQSLLGRCPRHAPTPLHNAGPLAQQIGLAGLYIKDESQRMGLGSFKALGAAYVIARAASAIAGEALDANSLKGHVFAAASAGNHGLSVAAGAAVFGARAVIYLADTVPEAFAERLRGKGAEVRRAGATYEDSMEMAAQDAKDNGWTLLSDSTWEGATEQGKGVMEGYLQLAAEAAEQMPHTPTHILLQAGVGGLAAAVAAFSRKTWGDTPIIIVVEPEAAPALIGAIKAGRLIDTEGPVSSMGRLDCKTASLVALGGLAEDADYFCTITENEAKDGISVLDQHGFRTTPSGGAGLAAMIAGLPEIGPSAQVLAFLSEGPEDG